MSQKEWKSLFRKQSQKRKDDESDEEDIKARKADFYKEIDKEEFF